MNLMPELFLYPFAALNAVVGWQNFRMYRMHRKPASLVMALGNGYFALILFLWKDL